MLARHNARAATRARDRFTDAVLDDWHKVLDHVDAHGLLPASHIDGLRTALGELRQAGAPVGSELFHAYFRALEAVSAGHRQDTAATVLQLGNTLLPAAAAGVASVDLPVWTTEAVVPLPAAAPGTGVRLPIRDGCVPAVGAVRAADEIKRLIADTWLVSREQAGLGIRAATTPVLFEIGKYGERTEALAGAPASLRPIDAASERGTAVVEKLLDAFGLIAGHDAQQAQEIATLTEYVVPMDGREFVGGSDLYLFGATFLRLRSDWSTLCYADHLVHEAAHQLLHAVQELHPLLLNRHQLGQPSPIRSDQRPLYGTFHATFVFLRLAQFMHRVLITGDPRHEGEAQIRLHRHLLGLLQGLRILDEHAVLSDDGEAEIDSWRETARDLVAAVGAPDPRLFRQLTWDYEPADERLPFTAA